jgi:hypothetical protein
MLAEVRAAQAPAVSVAQVEAAVTGTWPAVIEQSARAEIKLDDTKMIAELNARLKAGAGLPGGAEFDDGTEPSTWSGLVADCVDGTGRDNLSHWDYVIICQLAWGGHVSALPLSTAWLLANGLRLQEAWPVCFPRPELDDAFFAALDGARPGIWDPESMRGLFRTDYGSRPAD